MNGEHMQRPTRTLVIGIVAAAVAISGGAVVADASHHASFASSSAQDARLGPFGGPMVPPAGVRPEVAPDG